MRFVIATTPQKLKQDIDKAWAIAKAEGVTR